MEIPEFKKSGSILENAFDNLAIGGVAFIALLGLTVFGVYKIANNLSKNTTINI